MSVSCLIALVVQSADAFTASERAYAPFYVITSPKRGVIATGVARAQPTAMIAARQA
jgi:hypothetical protein